MPVSAGSVPSRLAREGQLSFMQEQWRGIALVVSFAMAVVVVLWFVLDGWWGGIVVGAAGASFAWIVGSTVSVGSGAGHKRLGAMGEAWTADELRAFARSGWRVLHNVAMGDRRDIDHVVVGPHGVFVLETKATAASWGSNSKSQFVHHAEVAAAVGADRIRRVLRFEGRLHVPIQPVVVLWGRGMPRSDRRSSIPVIRGSDLRAWLASAAGLGLAGETVDDVFAPIADYAARVSEPRRSWSIRDAVLRDGPVEILEQLAIGTASGFGAVAGFGVVARGAGFGVAVVTAALTAAAAVVALRRFRRLRMVAVGWIGGLAAVVALAVGAVSALVIAGVA